jgi:hypothetical protein
LSKEDIAQIDFGNPVLKNSVIWEHNKAITRKLCELGEVTEWIENPTKGYPSVPYHFLIEEVHVEFLPHWGFMKLNGIQIEIPVNIDGIMQQIKAVKMVNTIIKKLKY